MATLSPQTTATTNTTCSTRPRHPSPHVSSVNVPTVGGDDFRTHPSREAYLTEWNARVARGEDPKQGLVSKVEATPTSSFIEYWWRKVKGKEKTTALDKHKAAVRQEVEQYDREGADGQRSVVNERAQQGPVTHQPQKWSRYGDWEKERKTMKWHDKLRWGL